jgi:MoxR-like ATPase|tara:strand:- start:5771 stop:6901 length:1131 start_codon:yes stop_codon:yes gene_type:complete
MSENSEIFVQLARLALVGRVQDVHAYLRKVMKRIEKSDEDLAAHIASLLAATKPGPSAVLRDAGTFQVPVDADTRLSLIRQEHPVVLDAGPVLPGDIALRLTQVIAERRRVDELADQDLQPSKTLLFSGPPGVGKTLSARWIASSLGWPLISLDLATVMSSFLGKTGTNIRSVLDYAKGMQCVLLLDEFDAIAKRRDDDGDVGELKRLVTVLLQEIDTWPPTSLLIAATNHAELLDPAIWRRFDEVVQFPLPNSEQRALVIRKNLGNAGEELGPLIPVLEKLWEGRSSSDITRSLMWLRRRAAITDLTITEALLELIGQDVHAAAAADRKRIMGILSQMDLPQRKISAATGISRDTLRKYRGGKTDAVSDGEMNDG